MSELKFIGYIKTLGYIPYVKEKVHVLGDLEHFVIAKDEDYFSTIMPGRLRMLWIAPQKDLPKTIESNEISKYLLDAISYGLYEKDKPPTLIYPRPRISVNGEERRDSSWCEYNLFDDFMNRVLTQYSGYEILNAIKNTDIVLNINVDNVDDILSQYINKF